jgi:capsular exopolysaccharide synthesis family protein
MSRIHEALKKAEQGRAGVEAVDVAALPPAPRTIAGTEQRNAAPATKTDRLLEKGDKASAPPHYLRFDDLRAHCTHPAWHLNPNESVFNPALSVGVAEQFRSLRSRLYQLRSHHQLRILLVTSSVLGEGKTFVTSNLAQAIVRQPDHRCLIIDADLRCSRLHAPLGAPSAPGLTDYLGGRADETAVIQCGLEGNLCFIPGGNVVANPSELLSNGRLKTLLDRMVSVFDWVILDSPPCLPVADASVLADLCDGLLLVVKAGSTPLAIVQRTQQKLKGRNIVGVVLNSVEEDPLGYDSYYTSGYGQDLFNNPNK